ncbi:hypothetical protein [Desulfoluna butyratoxydans]|uniref:Six-bladed beta-propeller tolb-like n=1 Tax=Desulfoluna butyratoxydans TaxID=231438 RepID=A0A4U8YHX2_9BACT|nr:hypothetical protein [Desulfoluna butyratoxydans]VFQ42794.1 hypothetical protein MSL71_4150 [Desulfoluna butyratoxydans]
MKQINTCVLTVVLLSFITAGPLCGTPCHAGMEGADSMHGDTASSDTTPLPGPGSSGVESSKIFLSAACPTVLIRTDGKPFVLSTDHIMRHPVARLLKQRNGKELAKLSLEAGSLLGGVYAFLDSQDRLVMVDGRQRIIRIKAEKTNGLHGPTWSLAIDETATISSAVTGHCGGSDCDSVVSISPGTAGTIWFATQHSVVGIYDTAEGSTSWLKLADDERIDNSFSTTSCGRAAIVTSKALYVLWQDTANQPHIAWRHGYDAGTARKPGQLSHGSGATPTFFGPMTGTDYVMITDNADSGISLIVRDTEDGHLLCRKSLFTPPLNSGTENSAIGINNTVIVASTYGYPYPKYPEGAGDSVPKKADFPGGMVRIDINDCDEPCEACCVIWENNLRSAAVPKLSTADELIYTIERRAPSEGPNTTGVDSYYFSVVDFHTGEVLDKSEKIHFGLFGDTLQMAGNIGQDGVYWQGTLSGVVRITGLH